MKKICTSSGDFVFSQYINTHVMVKIFQFINADQEYIHLEIPKNLKGKLVEITIQEKAPDPDTQLNESDEEKMAHKEKELTMMDKVRNQLNVWDI